jgi:predicted DNA-binding antitoxin AbrB/MazE fold protein
MPITIEAIFENGMLRPLQPLPLKEHEAVRVTVETAGTWAERTSGLLCWPGDLDTLDRFITDSELDPQEDQ